MWKIQRNHQAVLLLADCYLRMGREDDVIRVLEPEEQKYPDDLAIAYMLGTALIRQKRVDEGEVLVDRILRNGDSAEAHLMMGSAKMNVQDYAGARDEFAKAVALNPNLPEVHVLYAKALMFTGDSDMSAKEYKTELTVDPYNFDANLQLGAAARQEQDYEQAEKYFERAQETRPGDPGVRYQLALIAIDEGRSRRCAADPRRFGEAVSAIYRGACLLVAGLLSPQAAGRQQAGAGDGSQVDGSKHKPSSPAPRFSDLGFGA